MNACPRCGGMLLPDELGDRWCWACGEGVYLPLHAMVDTLVDAILQREAREVARQIARSTSGVAGRRWDSPSDDASGPHPSTVPLGERWRARWDWRPEERSVA